ncbi:CGI121 [Candida jiufengensis]|uniref:CGI121 n=1 Tax=Candida jiufengensis TaxID=497108 RepID=UPI00222578F5|nr:CGI121 [Candida jiufengensis]KAI5956529.1 CGI121 [Candida jiufengensis]
MQANNLNTEILLNLSPVNVISDAIKRFGISEDCPKTIIIKVIKKDEDVDSEEIEKRINEIIEGDHVEINDEILLKMVDIPKFKKTYKLNDVKFTSEDNDDAKALQGKLTRLAIGASIIRGL